MKNDSHGVSSVTPKRIKVKRMYSSIAFVDIPVRHSLAMLLVPNLIIPHSFQAVKKCSIETSEYLMGKAAFITLGARGFFFLWRDL